MSRACTGPSLRWPLGMSDGGGVRAREVRSLTTPALVSSPVKEGLGECPVRPEVLIGAVPSGIGRNCAESGPTQRGGLRRRVLGGEEGAPSQSGLNLWVSVSRSRPVCSANSVLFCGFQCRNWAPVPGNPPRLARAAPIRLSRRFAFSLTPPRDRVTSSLASPDCPLP